MEVFYRLAIWHLILLSYVVLYPLVHQILGREPPSTLQIRIYLFFVMAFVATEVGFFLFDFGYSEFQTIILVLAFFFHMNIYRKLGVRIRSPSIEVASLNRDVLAKMNRALHGISPSEEDEGMEFEIKNVYQMRFVISAENNNKISWFQIFAIPSTFTTLIHLVAIYISLEALSDPLTETTTVNVLSYNIDAITAIIISIVASGVLIYMEFSSANAMALELPLLYKKILTKSSIEESRRSKPMVPDISDEESELEKARARAREILNARQSDVLFRKRDELKNKVDEIFATQENKIGLDPETLERVRLYNSVKRILISTPPWQTASLSKIAELAEGDLDSVELVIGTLIEKNEVPGIYDIWNQVYYGTPFSQWFANEVFKEIKNSETSVTSIRIHPDGSADISLKSQDLEKS